MRYRLRTLLILLAVGPPSLAVGHRVYRAIRWATMSQLERNFEEFSRVLDEQLRQQLQERSVQDTSKMNAALNSSE
jgi:hypothetical protein